MTDDETRKNYTFNLEDMMSMDNVNCQQIKQEQ